jgi:CDP-diacylglycerol--serine O-phosphatidyltransferase
VETDEEDSHEFFSGLPSPAAAGTVVSFLIAYPGLENLARPLAEGAGMWGRVSHNTAEFLLSALTFLLPIITLLCACLMVSRVRYSHVFNQWFRGRRSYQHILQLVVGIVTVFMVKELAIPLIFCGFSFGAPLRAAWARATHSKTPGTTASPAPSPGIPDPPGTDSAA